MAATRPVAASALTRLRAGTVPEQKDRGREPVDEVAPGDRTELTRREESSDRDVAERALHRTDVVVWLTEESLTAAVAGKQQRARNRGRTLRLEHRAQVLAR